MVRPGRFELPTFCLEGRCSIQLSYGRILGNSIISQYLCRYFKFCFGRGFGALWSNYRLKRRHLTFVCGPHPKSFALLLRQVSIKHIE